MSNCSSTRSAVLAAHGNNGNGGIGVWGDVGYGIGVQVTSKSVAGVEVHEITHTLAAFVIDGSGHERALFVGKRSILRNLCDGMFACHEV